MTYQQVLERLARDVTTCNRIIMNIGVGSRNMKGQLITYQRFLARLDIMLREGKQLQREEELGLSDLKVRTIKDWFSIKEELKAEKELLRRKKGRARGTRFERRVTLEKKGIRPLSNEEIAEKVKVDVSAVNVLKQIQDWRARLSEIITACIKFLRGTLMPELRKIIRDSKEDMAKILLADKEDRVVARGVRDPSERAIALRIHGLLQEAYVELKKIVGFARRVIGIIEEEIDNLRGTFGFAMAGIDIFNEIVSIREMVSRGAEIPKERKKEADYIMKFNSILKDREEKFNAAIKNFGYLAGLEEEMAESLVEEIEEIKRVEEIKIALENAERELVKVGQRVA